MAHGPYRQGELKIIQERAYDPYAFALTTTEVQHRLIHDGMFYQSSGKDTGLTNGATLDFLIMVPEGTYPHVQTMILNFGRGDIDFVAYEDATVSAPGTALPVQNVNRTSSNVPTLELYASPTVTDPGTQIFELWVPPTAAGNGQSANGITGVGQGSEWILNDNRNYLVRITNNSGSTIDWAHEFSWYEIDYS